MPNIGLWDTRGQSATSASRAAAHAFISSETTGILGRKRFFPDIDDDVLVAPLALSWDRSREGAVTLIPDIRHQLFNLGFEVSRERQQRQTHRPTKVAIQVHGVLQAGNAESTHYALGGLADALLLGTGEIEVT